MRAGFADLAAALGPVDVLINNAGFSKHCTLELSSPASWRGDIKGNLNGAYYCAHAVLPAMKERRAGAIVNIGSVNGLYALGDPAYSAGKAGMISLTKALAHGIRPLRHPRQHRPARHGAHAALGGRASAQSGGLWSSWCAGIRSGRIVEPIDVRERRGFPRSDAASAITGAVLPVDCGLTAGNIVMARELTLEAF